MDLYSIRESIKHHRGQTSSFGKALSKTSLLNDIIKSRKDFVKEEARAKRTEKELLGYFNSRKDRSLLRLWGEKIITEPLNYLLLVFGVVIAVALFNLLILR